MTNPPEAIPIADMEEPETSDAMALIAKAYDLFAHQHPAVIGPALADLTARWLTNHVVLGDAKETYKVRKEALKLQIEGIWKLVELHDTMDAAKQAKMQ